MLCIYCFEQLQFVEEFTDLGWFEGIICGEMNSEEKHTALIGTVRLQQRTHTHTQVTHSCRYTQALLTTVNMQLISTVFSLILTGPIIVACQ